MGEHRIIRKIMICNYCGKPFNSRYTRTPLCPEHRKLYRRNKHRLRMKKRRVRRRLSVLIKESKEHRRYLKPHQRVMLGTAYEIRLRKIDTLLKKLILIHSEVIKNRARFFDQRWK